MLSQLLTAARVLHPRALQGTLARVDRINDATRELRAQVDALRVRTEQLETAARLDWDLRAETNALGAALDRTRIANHVAKAVAQAPLVTDPFPHVVVENWLPDDVYQTVLRGVPPAVFFADQEERRQRLLVPFRAGPVFSRLVWDFVSEEVVGRCLRDALASTFEPVIAAYLRSFCPDIDPRTISLHPSDGRIMLRRPGYQISPHRDPKWGFVTGLIYLARPGDNEAYGTQLYRVRDDQDAPSDKPFYVDEARCDLARAVPFRANTLLAFLNSTGAHGASIPADAQPATLERYIYQFRLGPDTRAIKTIMARMPSAERERWSGAKAARAQ